MAGELSIHAHHGRGAHKRHPRAKHYTLEGQTHEVSVEAIAPVLVEFFKTDASPDRASPTKAVRFGNLHVSGGRNPLAGLLKNLIV